MAVYFLQWTATAGVSAETGEVAQAPADSHGDLPPVVLAWGGMIVEAAAIALLGTMRETPLRFTGSDVALLRGGPPGSPRCSLSAAIAYVTGIESARQLGPKLGSFVTVAEIGFTLLLAWILLHQTPPAAQFAGGALIAAGAIAVRLDEPQPESTSGGGDIT